MNFKIEDGKNIISVELNSIVNYFRYNDDPLSIVWKEIHQESEDVYFTSLAFNLKYRNEVEKKLQLIDFNTDYAENIKDLHSQLKSLFQLFKNGNYSMGFVKDAQYGVYRNSKEIRYKSFHIVFNKMISAIQITDKIKKKYKEYIKETKNENQHKESILEYSSVTLGGFWEIDTYGECFFSTIPYNNINHKRIKHYVNKINKGERPFAIIYSEDNNTMESGDCPYYILDGHHKLLAYRNVGIAPNIIFITRQENDMTNYTFDINKLSTILFPWQTKSILESLHQEGFNFDEVLTKPNSNLRTFIKANNLDDQFKQESLNNWSRLSDNTQLILLALCIILVLIIVKSCLP
ncbi:hypothetical protein [uncultured Dokdonia sp.]|uniref:hypothetical protein n=1 Tax=uncultured Dokdonia sp. TaxID=575653 RepID=UPI00261476AA|nr:hypothetical protein [uncultured Dokdonia sp.]